jgi:hypothetical protein
VTWTPPTSTTPQQNPRSPHPPRNQPSRRADGTSTLASSAASRATRSSEPAGPVATDRQPLASRALQKPGRQQHSVQLPADAGAAPATVIRPEAPRFGGARALGRRCLRQDQQHDADSAAPSRRTTSSSRGWQCCSSAWLSEKAVPENAQHAHGEAPQRPGARRPRDGQPGCDGRHGRFRNPPLQAIQVSVQSVGSGELGDWVLARVGGERVAEVFEQRAALQAAAGGGRQQPLDAALALLGLAAE